MIAIRLTNGEVWIRDEEWPEWVRSGRISPETWVSVSGSSSGPWKRAAELPMYRQLRPDLEDPDSAQKLYPHEVLGGAREAEPPQLPGLGSIIFPRAGFSSTELLLLANIVVAGLLLFLWKENYGSELANLMRQWFPFVSRGQYHYLIPTMFMHADPPHLLFNMASLLATSAAVEYFFGRWRTLGAYLLTGLGGAALSYAQKTTPILSVGASGAIFGFGGILVVFLIRFYRRFSERQKWKTRRIYVPLLVLFIAPSILRADGWAHLGGFATGLVLGALLPPHDRIRQTFRSLFRPTIFTDGESVVK